MGNNYDVYSIRKEITRLAVVYFIAAMYFATVYSAFKENTLIMWITVFVTYCNSAIISVICILGPYYDNKRTQERMHKPCSLCHKKQNSISNYESWQEFGLLYYYTQKRSPIMYITRLVYPRIHV